MSDFGKSFMHTILSITLPSGKSSFLTGIPYKLNKVLTNVSIYYVIIISFDETSQKVISIKFFAYFS